MIFWFTGQPGSGKTTLSRQLSSELKGRGHTVVELDGDEIRRQTGNQDYSHDGRVRNVKAGQDRAEELAAGGTIVIAAFVSPHRQLREELKKRAHVVEIYLHTSKPTPKDVFRVPDYEPPLERFIDLDTGELTVEQCLARVLEAFHLREEKKAKQKA